MRGLHGRQGSASPARDLLRLRLAARPAVTIKARQCRQRSFGSGARFAAPRSAPEGPPLGDATGLRIIRAGKGNEKRKDDRRMT
ncbi:hypothetical protein AU467_14900 [Mesorhizobium loti]|uniref:Uncharacterized protein n=1 Tax=Rhizobium loti TaxID=381 RepID=A0A101KW28_RHILI|nr:hypothetical protein AU467_14900 [Mesorhizobium loti]